MECMAGITKEYSVWIVLFKPFLNQKYAKSKKYAKGYLITIYWNITVMQLKKTNYKLEQDILRQ